LLYEKKDRNTEQTSSQSNAYSKKAMDKRMLKACTQRPQSTEELREKETDTDAPGNFLEPTKEQKREN
jgi:hypothetical protein